MKMGMDLITRRMGGGPECLGIDSGVSIRRRGGAEWLDGVCSKPQIPLPSPDLVLGSLIFTSAAIFSPG